MSLKKRILERLRSLRRWCARYEVESWARLWGYEGSTGARRANELAKANKIHQKTVSQRTTHNGKVYLVKIAYFRIHV